MMFKKSMMIGLVLCVLILGAFLPTLVGLKNIPQKTFGDDEDIVIITQAFDGRLPNMTLAAVIEEQEFVDQVSPEVFAYSSLNDVPIAVRGVDFQVFQAFEGIRLTANQTTAPVPSVIIGERLAGRLELDIGDEITITGSTTPAFFVARIEARFEGENDDEILLPLAVARKFVGFGKEDVSTIRVRTDQPDALLAFLQSGNISVNMGSTDQPGQPTNPGGGGSGGGGGGSSNQQVIEEIALRYTNLSFDIGNMSYMSVFVQRGSGSVGVVVYGFVFLSCALTFIGITAILAKGISERKKDIGVLYGIGATDARITLYFLREATLLAVPSALLGTAAGFFLSEMISSELSLVAFGKYITPETSLTIFLGVTLLSILIAAISCICCLFYLLKWNPSELISQSMANGKIQELPEALNGGGE